MTFSYTTLREDTVRDGMKRITRAYDAGRGVVFNVMIELESPDEKGRPLKGESSQQTIFIPDETVASLTSVFSSGYDTLTELDIAEGTAPMTMLVLGKTLTSGSIIVKQSQFEYPARNQPLTAFGIEVEYIPGTAVSGQDIVIAQAADDPWFEWNGTDLSQFDTKVEGTKVTSSTVAVASRGGLDWVRILVVAFEGSSPGNAGVFLPITQTPPSANYLIVADVINQQAASGIAGAIVGVRYTDPENAYITHFNDVSSQPAMETGKLLSSATFTVFITQNSPTFSGTGKGFQMGCAADSNTTFYGYGQSLVMVGETGGITGAGKAVIGSSPSSTGTCDNYFRNIRCYDIENINRVF